MEYVAECPCGWDGNLDLCPSREPHYRVECPRCGDEEISVYRESDRPKGEIPPQVLDALAIDTEESRKLVREWEEKTGQKTEVVTDA